MADDARISTALPRHPKTVKLQRRLGSSGCWSLVCLFLWVAENHPEGDLGGMTAEDIEIAASWPGDTGAFVRILAEVRFLDGQEGAYKIHDWAEHNPYAASRPSRVANARAAASVRWKSKRVAFDRNATSIQGACESQQTAMPASPHLAPPHNAGVNPLSELCTSNLIEPTRLPKKDEPKKLSDRAVRLAQKLHDEILKNKPDFHFRESWLLSWSNVADRMMNIDGRSYERISALIEWVQGDHFWRSNALSMDKFREKFDELEMKARLQRDGRANNGNGKPGIAEVIERECAIVRERTH
jgi:hypothetical protein